MFLVYSCWRRRDVGTCHHQSKRQDRTVSEQQIWLSLLQLQHQDPINTNWCPYDGEVSDEVKMILNPHFLYSIIVCFQRVLLLIHSGNNNIVYKNRNRKTSPHFSSMILCATSYDSFDVVIVQTRLELYFPPFYLKCIENLDYQFCDFFKTGEV